MAGRSPGGWASSLAAVVPTVVRMVPGLVVPMVDPVVARVVRMVPGPVMAGLVMAGLVVPGLAMPMMSSVVARVVRMVPGPVVPAVSRVVLAMMPFVLDLVRGLSGAVSFVPAGAALCCGARQRDVHVVAVPEGRGASFEPLATGVQVSVPLVVVRRGVDVVVPDDIHDAHAPCERVRVPEPVSPAQAVQEVGCVMTVPAGSGVERPVERAPLLVLGHSAGRTRPGNPEGS